MTTSITVINNGPDRVTVSPVDDAGNPSLHERVTLASNERHDVTVYGNRNVHVQEGVPDVGQEAKGGSEGGGQQEKTEEEQA